MMVRRIVSLILLLAGTASGQVPEELIARGDSAQAVFRPDVALRFYRQADRVQPANPDVLWRISKVHTDLSIGEEGSEPAMREAERAVEYAKRAVGHDAHHSMAHAVLAVAYGQKAVLVPNRQKMDLSKLLHIHGMRALELDSTNTVALLVLGIWHREVASLSWIVRLLLKAAYGGVPEASLSTSKDMLERAVALQPEMIMGRVELAKTLVELDEHRTAARHLRKALTLPRSDLHDPARKEEAEELLNDLGGR
jgi:tetratricopeptide (TPR) repeat protein